MSLSTAHAALSALGTCAVLREVDLRGDIFLFASILAYAGLGTWHYLATDTGLVRALLYAARLLGAHLSSAAAITALYRISPFHPLHSFPGPTLNKVTGVTLLSMVATGRKHIIVDKLHEKYGTFVRIAPNTISINSHEAISPIYAAANAFDKSHLYRLGRIVADCLFFIRERAPHADRRKIWAGAFTPSTLNETSPLLNGRTRQLVACINKRKDSRGVVDLQTCLRHWAYDVTGDLVFGRSNRIEMMEEGDREGLIENEQTAVAVFEIITQVPPLMDVLSLFPPAQELHRLERLSHACIASRYKSTSQTKGTDLLSYFLAEHKEAAHEALKEESLISETSFAMDAGAGTTPGVLALTFYYILSRRDAYERLTQELDLAFPSGEIEADDIASLSALPYLSAVVNEGLRLSSPFPGMPRVVPKGGLAVKNRFIPEGCVVNVPIWSQHVSTENFSPAPHEFRPERWLPEGLGPNSVCRGGALMSFMFGGFGCIGKPLAMRQLSAGLAHLLLAFDFKLAPDFDPVAFQNSVKNYRTTVIKQPLLVQAISRRR